MIRDIDHSSELIIFHPIQPTDRFTLHFLCLPAIYFILSGKAHFRTGNRQITLNAAQLLLINSFESLAIQSEEAMIGQFILNLPLFEQKLGVPVPNHFECNSQNTPDAAVFDDLKKLLAQYALSGKEDPSCRPLLAFEILGILKTRFSQKLSRPQPLGERSGSRHLEQALKYMQQHYRESLTLKDIAGNCYVSIPYLSKLFKENFHHSIFNVLTRIRLSNAWPAVIQGMDTIEAIAQKNGFSNTRSFTKAFLAQYGNYPSDYRKNADAKKTSAQNHLAHLLLPYTRVLPASASGLIPGNTPVLQQSLQVPADAPGTTISHQLFNLLFVGDVRHISITELKNMLVSVQKGLPHTYAYVTGLLSTLLLPSMESARPDTLRLSFVHVDTILDLIVGAGLIPCIDLDCTDHGLRDIPGHTRALLGHLKNQYGLTDLKRWLFIPGSCPLNFFAPQEHALRADFEYYWQLYRIVKDTDPQIQVGSPRLQLGRYEPVWDWLMGFTEFCIAKGCICDFYSLIHYPISPGNDKNGKFTFYQNETNDMMPQMLNRFETLLSSGAIPKRPAFIVEWNTSISNQDFTNDSLFKAAHLLENLLATYDKAQGFGFSQQFDGLEMFPASFLPVHGGNGLICNNGTKKPAFWALFWLHRMGDTLLARGRGCFVTRRADSYQIYLYHPAPMGLSFAANINSLRTVDALINSSPVDAQGQPLSASAIEKLLDCRIAPAGFDIALEALPFKEYTVTRLHFTRRQCECFTKAYDRLCICPRNRLTDYWNAAVTPEILCQPYKAQSQELRKGYRLHLSYTLMPGEIAFIEVIPLRNPQ